ncbi:unnamed protein product, partial [Mesorhabditis belari]|uniref:Domain of unknown function DB domain-containing protein n=1 Tax=Mesorhabditis belari TaxID=2138241 RepID=A0AAF3ENI5_9BILA
MLFDSLIFSSILCPIFELLLCLWSVPTGPLRPPQPPPTPMCGGCSQGRGSYACRFDPLESRREIFERCCVERNLPDSCITKCSYQSYNENGFTDACPMQAAADIHLPAAQGKDHSTCCFQNGATTTLAGSKCMTFCDQRPGHITQLDITYLACYDRFESMKSSFYYEMSNGNGANEPPVSIPADPLLAENSQNVFQIKRTKCKTSFGKSLMNRDPSIGGELEIEDYDNDNVSGECYAILFTSLARRNLDFDQDL